jgi:hypothetical protein
MHRIVKSKPKAKLKVADGAGGLLEVVDRRFDSSEWPISFQVPASEAEDWFCHLQFECERRGWSSAGMSQQQSRENSGSLMLLEAGVEKLSVVWDRPRGDALNIRARPAADMDLADARECFRRVNERSRAGATELRYWWGILEYEGRAWRGELWLCDNLRLGPPTKYEKASRGPRAVVVDALVDCISQAQVLHIFSQLLEELAAFLSVVVTASFRRSRQGQVWTWAPTAEGTDCSVRQLGYIETANRSGMPARGTCRPVPVGAADITEEEQAVPQDIVSLWEKYRSLTEERRWQFLWVASKFQEARWHWGEQRWTASFTSLVVACEALKPADAVYSEHNVYDVTDALLGKEAGERLHTQLFDPLIHPEVHPQSIRNAHLHRGEFYGSEFAHRVAMSNFRDPTFDEATRELFKIAKAAIIEWLCRGGVFEMPTPNRKRTRRQAAGGPVHAECGQGHQTASPDHSDDPRRPGNGQRADTE